MVLDEKLRLEKVDNLTLSAQPPPWMIIGLDLADESLDRVRAKKVPLGTDDYLESQIRNAEVK